MRSEFLYGDINGIAAGNFCGYEGYGTKSSKVSLLATEGVLCKDKPKRKPAKALREFASLHVWKRLLQGEMLDEGDMRVDSPTPLALDNRYRIYMNFAPGVTIFQAISCGYPSSMPKTEMQEARLSCAEHIGRLIRIKEREQLVHGDFRARHMLFNPPRDSMGLSVIDVEHSNISSFGLRKEHSRLLEELRATVRMSKLWLRLVNDSFDRGYSEPIEPDSRIHDVIASVRADLQMPEFTME